jgi:hypothetical protein
LRRVKLFDLDLPLFIWKYKYLKHVNLEFGLLMVINWTTEVRPKLIDALVASINLGQMEYYFYAIT